MTLTLAPDQLDESEADEVIAAADPARRAGLRVSVGGYLGQEVSSPRPSRARRSGSLVAVIVLLFAFGTAVAMSLPIITALFGLGTGLALIGIAGHVISVPSIAPTLATMLGLGVGIDYSLFIVTRHLGFIKEGHPPHEAAARAPRPRPEARCCSPAAPSSSRCWPSTSAASRSSGRSATRRRSSSPSRSSRR